MTKLIICASCNDIVNLITSERRFCFCLNSWGNYLTPLLAEYGGKAIPLGINNSSLMKSLNNPGMEFTAFSIESNCKTFKKE